MTKRTTWAALALGASLTGYAQTDTSHVVVDTTAMSATYGTEQSMKEVVKVARRPGVTRMAGAINGFKVNRTELFKAACCNLGESFVTNPSVDVSYSDAATGAKQIRLLGLSGTYVQMLTENIPDFRGAALPYALGYVPGPWMNSIQVSKGASSVKNGYESVTGQINIEYLQPTADQAVEVNLFGDAKSRNAANAAASAHLSDRLSTEVLMHYENSINNHDENHDGFYDKPTVEQYNVQNRWVWMGDRYIFHGGLSALKENRNGGQMGHGGGTPFAIGMNTDRYEAYAKNAFVIDPAHATNIALVTTATMHRLDAGYGRKSYYVNEKNLYASLMFETDFSPRHKLSAGLSLNHDYFGQLYNARNVAAAPKERLNERETTPGAYVQYTFNLDDRLTAMAGLRADRSSLYGTFVTPRFHVKYKANDVLTLRLSAGKGYRTPHALAENNYLLASGRTLVVDRLEQEAAWNYGASVALDIPLFDQVLKVNAEYFYTDFDRQTVIDYDTDPSVIHIANLNGKSFSHTFQIDATYPLFRGMTLTAAYRLNRVMTTYGGRLLEKPLTNRYKGLLTASYKTPLGLWQFDATLQVNGGGRLPGPYTRTDGRPSWSGRFHSFEQLSAQVTRWFRHWSVYVGGENLTNFKQKESIFGADDPWGKDFEPTLVWGPVHGFMLYAGVRVKIGYR